MTVLIFLNLMMKTFVAFTRNYTVKMWRIGLNAVASVVCIAILEMLHAALLVLVKAGHMKLVQMIQQFLNASIVKTDYCFIKHSQFLFERHCYFFYVGLHTVVDSD